MTTRFTGWHMAAILAGFFGIVVAVNVYMARAAMATFGGTVVDNSYVASQKFNGWLAAAKKQEMLGWQTAVAIDADRYVRVSASRAGLPIAGISGSGQASHPLGAQPPVALSFAHAADGSLKSVQPLPDGRWLIYVAVQGAGETVKLSADLQ